jgi:hypothetical protein
MVIKRHGQYLVVPEKVFNLNINNTLKLRD